MLTHLHFLRDLEVFMDNVLNLHHEHLTKGARGGLHHHLHLALGAHVSLSLLLDPLGLPAGLLLVFSLGLFQLHLQLSVDVDPEDREKQGKPEAGSGPGTEGKGPAAGGAGWPGALGTPLPSWDSDASTRLPLGSSPPMWSQFPTPSPAAIRGRYL